MNIIRKDSEDTEDTDELMAKNITEAVCDQFGDWLGEPAPFNLKADIYCRVRKAQTDGIREIFEELEKYNPNAEGVNVELDFENTTLQVEWYTEGNYMHESAFAYPSLSTMIKNILISGGKL